MSESLSRDEREGRAFDALIVSNLLRERDPEDLNDLPELSEAMKAKMNSISDEFIGDLWEKTSQVCSDDGDELEEESFQFTFEDHEQFAGSGANRAEMDDETIKKLDEARRLARETIIKRKRNRGDAKS